MTSYSLYKLNSNLLLLGRSNFLQVDLYYEDLQYQVVEEQKAFVIGSLFSEVGGFLGLLLGASIITVCELVDYLLMSCGNKLRNG